MAYTITYPSRGYCAPDYKGTLWLCCLTPEQHARTCRYWYTISDNSTSYTAFRTRAALLRWLDVRGLTLSGELPAQLGEHAVLIVIGSFRECMHMELTAERFNQLRGERVRLMSNGQYTVGIVTQDDDGLRTVHLMNPNCRDRHVFDWRESDALVDAGEA